MEPKSIAFYTAVAVSILAVLSATTFPTLVQAQAQSEEIAADDDAGQTPEENEELTEVDESPDSPEEGAAEKETAGPNNDDMSNGQTSADSAASRSLGLDQSNSVASCGEVITTDVELTSDLACEGDALIIGADGVHVNANGHSIRSSAEENSAEPTMGYSGSSGILVANADNVVISGLGEVVGFDTGITIIGSSGTQVTDLQLANNGIGVLMTGSEGTEISRNTMTNNEIAVVSDSSNEGVIAFNQIVANLEQGILLQGSANNVVAANNLFGNGNYGVSLDAQSTENTIDFVTAFGHEIADLNNAGGLPTSVNQNSFGENNNCGTSLPGGLCR